MMYPVFITGEKVALREFNLEDGESAFAIVGDPKVTNWLSFDSRTLEQSKEMVAGIVRRAQHEPRTEYYFAVTSLDSDGLMGFARLGLSGVRAAKLGFAIAASSWGRGYATDAARNLMGFAFREIGLHRVTAAIGPQNSASVAIVKKLGFQYEGRLRDHVFTNGEWRDSLLYSLLEQEWDEATRRKRTRPAATPKT